jgi:dTDP-4-amino-4,6-dideoxygalactose transaminase
VRNEARDEQDGVIEMSSAATSRAARRDPAQPAAIPVQPDEAWPFYAEDEIEAAAAVLRSGRVNQWTGGEVFAFQDACTERFGGGHGIALANGSLAIELPLRAYGIGPGDEVIVTPRSFVASASSVSLIGATPVFAEVDRDSGNLDPKSLEVAVTDRTRAIIPVHLAGWPADMAGIMAIAEKHDLLVIEDCAQAHGAEIDGRPIGSFGHAAAFSFCQDKIISTGGEGGFASFQDRERWQWAWSFKDHGKNWDKVTSPPKEPGFRWLHDTIGTNWRLTGMQAAIGLAQLAKLDQWRALRTRNAQIWLDALAGIRGIRRPMPPAGIVHAYYKLYFYVDAGERSEALRNAILARAAEAGLRVFSGSCSEIYLEEAFSAMERPMLPVARELGKTSLMVEVHPTLRPDLIASRAEMLRRIIESVLG